MRHTEIKRNRKANIEGVIMGWSTERYPRKKTPRKKSQERREENAKEKLEELIRRQNWKR